jgi:hypothetical protein
MGAHALEPLALLGVAAERRHLVPGRDQQRVPPADPRLQ